MTVGGTSGGNAPIRHRGCLAALANSIPNVQVCPPGSQCPITSEPAPTVLGSTRNFSLGRSSSHFQPSTPCSSLLLNLASAPLDKLSLCRLRNGRSFSLSLPRVLSHDQESPLLNSPEEKIYQGHEKNAGHDDPLPRRPPGLPVGRQPDHVPEATLRNAGFRMAGRRFQATAAEGGAAPAEAQGFFKRMWDSPVGFKTVHFW